MNGKKCLLISPVAENNFGGGIGLNKSRILLTELFRDNLYCVDFRMGVLSNVQKLRWTLQGYQAVTDPHLAPASGNTLGALGTSGGRKNACRIW